MSDRIFGDCLKRQFDDAFGVLAGALGRFTVEQWTTGSSPYNGPARATLHALQCAEFYTAEDRDVFTRLGKPVWEMGADDLPGQEEMIDFLKRAREMTAAWIDDLAGKGLDQPCGEDRTVALERIVYALRHLQHHTGEVCAWQKQFGIPMTQWE